MKHWIGKTETTHDVATAWPVAAVAATFDRTDAEPRAGDAIAPGWHWLYFQEAKSASEHPGLIVHGPMQTLLMLDLCRRNEKRPVRKLDYRALYPVFRTMPMTINGNPAADGSKIDLWTANGAGNYAMVGTAQI
ncbi:MAG: hypothetical protein ACXWCP_07240 [Burkholderiales bacterium]